MKTTVAFGEVLMRFSPPGLNRFCQSAPGPWDLTFGGAEANVAAALAQWGAPARLLTAHPDHPLGKASLEFYAGMGIDTATCLKKGAGRMGIYFYENGTTQRPGQVIYDREGSTISTTHASEYDWEAALHDAGFLFISGITPGISKAAAEATLQAAIEAKRRGVMIFFDLNFRRKLWRWDPEMSPAELAASVLTPIIRLSDCLIANNGAAADIFTLSSESPLQHRAALEVARGLSDLFPNLSLIAMTLREQISASHNRWGGLLYNPRNNDTEYSPQVAGCYCPYEISPITDRVGAGDAFAAGLIYALNTPELEEKALSFATAASCLCHSIPGDVCYATVEEIAALMKDGGAGYVVR